MNFYSIRNFAFVVLGLLIFNCSCLIAEYVKTEIDPKCTIVGVPVNLTITIGLSVPKSIVELARIQKLQLITESPDFPKIPQVDGLVIKYSDVSNDTINDSSEKREITKFKYTITPYQAGNFVIIPFDIQLGKRKIKSDSIMLRVDTLWVNYDTDGGTSLEPTAAKFNTNLRLPANPVRPGYVFAGWMTAKTGGEIFTSSTIVQQTSNFTLYANWEKISNHESVFETILHEPNQQAAASLQKNTTKPGKQVTLQAPPPKEALLIANGKYSHFPGLANPLPDAERLGAVLQGLGFRVRVVKNGSREEILDGIKDFENSVRGTNAIAFFHYGGHGVQVGGKNYLLPADADIPDERRVATRAVELEEVMGALETANARANVVVIDACRNNPLPTIAGRDSARGLSVLGSKPKNSIIIYAAEAGSVAVDGLFTPIFATALAAKGRTIEQVMKLVRSEVYAKSSGQQTPGEYNQLFEELFLGELAGGDLSAETVFAATPEPTPFAAPTPAPAAKDDMVLVEGGTMPDVSELAGKSVKSFYIGRTEVTWLEWKKVRNWASDQGYDIGSVGTGSANEHPVRDVSWYDCIKWCNAKSEMENLSPVYELNGKIYRTGHLRARELSRNANASGYRLPIVAEWEWAARGGVESQGYKYSGSDNLCAVSWYSENSGTKTLNWGNPNIRTDWSKIDKYTNRNTNSVGKKLKNELGIYDMSGNVREWCWDWNEDVGSICYDGYGGPFFRHRICGGSWNSEMASCSVSHYEVEDSTIRNACNGFRVARNQ